MFNTESKLIYSSRTVSVAGTPVSIDIRAARGVYSCVYNGIHTIIPKSSVHSIILAHSKYLGNVCCISERIYTRSNTPPDITFDSSSTGSTIIIGRPDFKTHAIIQEHNEYTYIDISDLDIIAFAQHHGISLIRKIPIVIVNDVYIHD